MNNFKKLFLYLGLIICTCVYPENEHQILEQKIYFLENIIADLMQNGTAQNYVPTSTDLGDEHVDQDDDHRMTLRIPKWLLLKIDEKRKQRVGKISRNLWILEVILKAIEK